MGDSNSPPEWPALQGETTSSSSKKGDEWPHALNINHFNKLNSLIRQEKLDELLRVEDNDEKLPVNLMGDPVLNVVIACKKTQLAINLIQKMDDPDRLMNKNCYGDTALHVAAALDDVQVARELLRKKPLLAYEKNTKEETTLHKAALNGHRNMFWFLVGEMNDADRIKILKARTEHGANVLHYAIMGNAPGLALQIAREYKELINSRTDLAVTPLQLMVTIPDLFRSQTVLGRLDSFLYPWIPVEDEHKEPKGSDEESAPASSKIGVGGTEDGHKVVDIVIEVLQAVVSLNIPGVLKNLKPLVAWIILCVLKILMPVSSTFQNLENLKRRHKQALELVGVMAAEAYSFDFFGKGSTGVSGTEVASKEMRIAQHLAGHFANGGPETASRDMLIALALSHHLTTNTSGPDTVLAELDVMKVLQEMSGKQITRWHESPLITGTRLGLYDFVEKILCVHPQSATYLDDDGRNVLQAAIEFGRKEIVKTIDKMTSGNNPVLPSWLLSRVDVKTRNTILHFAADKIETTEGDAVQLQDEIKWFEMVKKILPEELRNYRNSEEKTAQELFTEKHEKMLASCKTQLMEMGKTCSALVAAVVFASSFSTPTGNQLYIDRLAFKVFSHAYVIGFGCAATSLVLFLSLIITPYKESDFRRAVPVKYFLAALSFAMALLAFLISFACNFYLQIYGGHRTERREMIPLILELTVFPAVCFIALLYNGAKFGPSFSRIWATV